MLDGILGGGFQSPPPNNTQPPSSTSPSGQTPASSQPSTGQQTQPSTAAPEEDTRPEDIDDGTYTGTAPSDADDSNDAQSADNSAGNGPPASAPTGNPPATATPVASQPSENQPAPSEPVATQPVTPQPSAAQPVAQKPVVSKPSPAVAAPVADPADTGDDVTVTDHVTAFLTQMKEIQDRYASVSLAEKDKTRQRAETMMQALLASQMIESMANPKNFGANSLFDNSSQTDEADSLPVQWYKEA